MKYLFLSFILCFANTSFSQGIISDIMLVETVSIDLSEVNEKLVSRYKQTLEEESADMDEDLNKIDQKYQEEVTTFIEDFTDKLKDGEQNIVTNQKYITISRVNSLTMTHRTDKKNRVQEFLNEMQLANRRLPVFLRKDYTASVKEKGSTHFDTIERDYRAHLVTIEAFEAREHLIITEGEAVNTVPAKVESINTAPAN